MARTRAMRARHPSPVPNAPAPAGSGNATQTNATPNSSTVRRSLRPSTIRDTERSLEEQVGVFVLQRPSLSLRRLRPSTRTAAEQSEAKKRTKSMTTQKYPKVPKGRKAKASKAPKAPPKKKTVRRRAASQANQEIADTIVVQSTSQPVNEAPEAEESEEHPSLSVHDDEEEEQEEEQEEADDVPMDDGEIPHAPTPADPSHSTSDSGENGQDNPNLHSSDHGDAENETVVVDEYGNYLPAPTPRNPASSHDTDQNEAGEDDNGSGSTSEASSGHDSDKENRDPNEGFHVAPAQPAEDAADDGEEPTEDADEDDNNDQMRQMHEAGHYLETMNPVPNGLHAAADDGNVLGPIFVCCNCRREWDGFQIVYRCVCSHYMQYCRDCADLRISEEDRVLG
ncbi:MAG: hypothetical protein Q9160_009105 [Pyrenula sp. 1 TL-2023]